MMKKIPCPKCDGWGHISEVGENSISGYTCKECNGSGQIEVSMTNADRIRAMSDEELAAYLLGISTAECPFKEVRCDIYKDKTCAKCWADWLQQPAEGE